MFTHTGFQLFPVSYIFGNLEKTLKYSMHGIRSFKYQNICITNVIYNRLVRYCYNLYIYQMLYITFNILYYSYMDLSRSAAMY